MAITSYTKTNIVDKAISVLTIAAGVVTVTQGYHNITSETGTSDDLATISGGVTGAYITIKATTGHTITVKHGTGNINLGSSADIVLSGGDEIKLHYDGTNWVSDSGGGDVVYLADSTLDADAASFDIQNISALYKHLRLVCSLRSDRAATTDGVLLRMNNDSGANYDSMYSTLVHSASLATTESLAATSMLAGWSPAASAPASTFGALTIDIPNYASANIYKTITANFSGASAATTGTITVGQAVGIWKATTAISRLTLLPQNGANFKQYSRVTLYGLK